MRKETGFIHTILNLFYPEQCVGCRKKGTFLCEACRAELPPAPRSMHPDILPLFAYQDERVRQAVRLLKYRGAQSLAVAMGEAMRPSLPARVEMILPIPLSPARLRTRGFNQAELIARALADEKVRTDLLEKAKETPTQVSLGNRANRLKNLAGAFSVPRPGSVADKRLLLVDDVATTGATLLEARRALILAGARSVQALVFAH